MNTAEALADWVVPNDIPVGTHQITIVLDSFGVIGSFTGKILFAMDTYEPTTACSGGGSEIVINGSGFSEHTEVFIGTERCVIHT